METPIRWCCRWTAATVIEIGDLVYLEPTTAKPAGGLTDGGSLAAKQEAFHDKFAGVAMQQSRAGDTQDIRVATTGVFEFDCASARSRWATRIGVDDNAGGTALVNQQVIAVAAANPELSIGYCAKRVNPAAHQRAGRHRRHGQRTADRRPWRKRRHGGSPRHFSTPDH